MTRKTWTINQSEFKSAGTPRISHDTVVLLRIMALLGAICLFSYLGAAESSACPNCGEKFEIRGTWRGTWVCPNKKCKYENMDGIDYCGLCGTWRYEK